MIDSFPLLDELNEFIISYNNRLLHLKCHDYGVILILITVDLFNIVFRARGIGIKTNLF